MKIAVVGARIHPEPLLVKNFVASLPKDWEIVSGGARGVDTFAEEQACADGRLVTVFYADWDRVGKAAGMMRNTEIATYCSACVAFIYGPSKGTLDTVRKVAGMHKPVWVVDEFDDAPTPEQILAKVTAFRSSSGS
jgi:hypothetical protein